MAFVITTQTGSKYEIDDSRSTWKRLCIGNDAYTTRTPDGVFITRSEIVVGKPFSMTGAGLERGVRVIQTTPVVDAIQI